MPVVNLQEMVRNKDQVSRVKETEGKAREVAGKLGGSKKQEDKGKAEKNLARFRRVNDQRGRNC
ncbi:hypothetical protein TPL01_24010 [Sulfuriferula plumbiphila]|uniref:CsbD-like domain-containing protein n=2 Tax=Sulfuriferula plumbiphila TaxID=171865 RepID=A0A512L9V4_9PROT|nr:hypothetical protein SFPGR_26700 [Sulfuriferula plumbiphila]GEP31263.1 hypothetical protein TPL01_24010 [Sulfuriferula plumbiphila]